MPDNDPSAGERQARLHEARLYAAELTARSMEAIAHVESIVRVPLREPERVRRETPLPEGADISEEQEGEIRTSVRTLGIGLEEDLTVEKAGFSDDAQVNIEGGRVDGKIQAELTLALDGGDGPLVMMLAKTRSVDQVEKDFMQRTVPQVADPGALSLLERLGIDPRAPRSEYDGGVCLAVTSGAFVPLERPVAVGHVNTQGVVNGEGITGSLLKIGTLDGRDLYVQEVPGEVQRDAEGQVAVDNHGNPKFDQPNAGQILAATAILLDAREAALATSGTYLTSRLATVVAAAYRDVLRGARPRKLGVVGYSAPSLALAKGLDAPEVPSLGHVLGEVYASRRDLTALNALIQG